MSELVDLEQPVQPLITDLKEGVTEGRDFSRSRDSQLQIAGLENRTLRYGSYFAIA